MYKCWESGGISESISFLGSGSIVEPNDLGIYVMAYGVKTLPLHEFAQGHHLLESVICTNWPNDSRSGRGWPSSLIIPGR